MSVLSDFGGDGDSRDPEPREHQLNEDFVLESAITRRYDTCCADHPLPCWEHYQEGHR